MRGAGLDRYQENPVLLDSHDRRSIEAIVGRGTNVRVEDGQLVVRAEFAEVPRGNLAWDLVRGGFLRALSIGYAVDPASVRTIRAGETDGDVSGPASVVDRWELLEISVVPVPADKAALMRQRAAKARSRVMAKKIAKAAKRGEKLGAALTAAVDAAVQGGMSMEDVVATLASAAAIEPEEVDGVLSGGLNPSADQLAAMADALGLELEPLAAALAEDTAEPPPTEEAAAPRAGEEAGDDEMLPEERAARVLMARNKAVRDLVRHGSPLRALAETLLLEPLTLEQIRERLLREATKGMAPVGTPEPDEPTTSGERDDGKEITEKFERALSRVSPKERA
jgi:HK97 family phage prohead protease